NLLMLALKSSQFLSAPPFDLLILFVEHILKKLNVNYNIYRAGATGGTNSIQEYSWMPRNSSRWLQTVERVLTISSDTGINNNFQIFLFFLDTQLHRLFASVSNGVSSDGKSQYLNFQKLVSKIVVTLQPRSLKQIEPM